MKKGNTILLILLFSVFGMTFAIAQTNVINLREIFLVEIDGVEITDGALTTITYPHHEMHEGNHYFVKTWVENTGGTGTSDYFSFTTPSGEDRVHAKTILKADTDTIFNIFEGCNITGGVPVTTFNNDRDSNKTSGLQPLAGITIVDNGTLMWSSRSGAGREPAGVTLASDYEIIAKTNYTYCFQLQKKTTADTIIDVDFFWYEEGLS